MLRPPSGPCLAAGITLTRLLPPMKIAIVDDSKFMRRLIREAVRQLSPRADITEFDDGEAALDKLPDVSPDVITLDMVMPKVGGLEFLERLRILPNPPRVIVITANIQNSVRQKCAELGVTDFIEKPITFDKLQAAFFKLLTA